MDKKISIEYIKWIDPYSDDDDWTLLSKIEVDIPPVESIGFVVKENKDYVVLAHSVGRKPGKKEDECCGMMIIPVGAIVKRRKINVDKVQKKRR